MNEAESWITLLSSMASDVIEVAGEMQRKGDSMTEEERKMVQTVQLYNVKIEEWGDAKKAT